MKGPGVEKLIIEEIDVAARDYIDVRDKRMALTKKEVELKTVLANKMHEHQLTTYDFDDVRVQIDQGTEKLKVQKIKVESDAGADAQ